MDRSLTATLDTGDVVTVGVNLAAPPTKPVPLPGMLMSSVAVPAGAWLPPPSPIKIQGTVTVDISAASIIGTGGGYLFAVQPGANLTVTGAGYVAGVSLVSADAVPWGQTATVTLRRLIGVNNPALIFQKTQTGGTLTVTLDQILVFNNGTGVRTVLQTLVVTPGTYLYGGGKPPSANAAGIHALDNMANIVAVPGSSMNISGATIMGYSDPSGQGDGIVGETGMAACSISGCRLGYNADSGAVDSKMTNVQVVGNWIWSTGSRALASHFGMLTSKSNTICYQAARTGTSAGGSVGKVYEATGGLVATGDTIVTLEPGANLAVAEVVMAPGSGPPATYPRVGHITLNQINSKGPVRVNPAGGLMPTVDVYP